MDKQDKNISIEIYSDVICPWCYIGKRRLERALSHYTVSSMDNAAALLRWRPFQLNPTMPKQGMDRTAYLEAKFGNLDAFRRLEDQVVAVGASEQIAFAFDKIQTTPNTLLAHRLIWYAGQQGQQDRIVEALFKGYFEEGVDIGSQSALGNLAASTGMDAARFLETDAGTDAVKEEESFGHRLGIRAVPYMVLNQEYGISGAQPSEVFVRAIEKVARQAEAESSRR